MAANAELAITWDGPVKGLAAHRVSLNEFGDALTALVAAARRIASNLVMNAAEPAESGRLAALAKHIDIEIAGVVKGSGGFTTFLTLENPASPQAEMLNRLVGNVGRELLESIEAESSGTQRNAAVRKYLQYLPKALTHQVYDLREDGQSLKTVTIGKMNLPALMMDPLPSLVEMNGRIGGVGFEPRLEVRLRGEGGQQMVATATDKQVSQALDMRSQESRALAISDSGGTRLVLLERQPTDRKKLTLDEIFDQWDETFRALA